MYFSFFLNDLKKQLLKNSKKPTVLHRQTCPCCNRKLVNLYPLNNSKKYLCKICIDKNDLSL